MKSRIDKVIEIFDNGNNWIKGKYADCGKYCLAGAVICSLSGPDDMATARNYIYQALTEYYPKYAGSIIYFNDSLAIRWADVAKVLNRAKELEAHYGN